MSKLTEKQEIFVEHFHKTYDLEESAKEAGYSNTSPAHVLQDVISSEAVRNALMDSLEAEDFMSFHQLNSLGKLAVEKMEEMLEDSDISDKVKLSIINSILDRKENLKRVFGVDFGGEIEHSGEVGFDPSDQTKAIIGALEDKRKRDGEGTGDEGAG